MYKVRGKTFNTLREIWETFGISRRYLQDKRKEGYTILEAIQMAEKKRVVKNGKVYKNFYQYCLQNGLCYITEYQRKFKGKKKIKPSKCSIYHTTQRKIKYIKELQVKYGKEL